MVVPVGVVISPVLLLIFIVALAAEEEVVVVLSPVPVLLLLLLIFVGASVVGEVTSTKKMLAQAITNHRECLIQSILYQIFVL